MIYTVTFNPSLDYVVRVTDFMPGKLHRTQEEELFAGGKGINVSTVLHELGEETIALGFAAGFTGKELIRRLDELGLPSDFILLDHGVSRINVKLKSGGNTETEINGQGPTITLEALNSLYDKLKRMGDGDYLVLSGSIPNGLPEELYSDISKLASKSGVRLVIDAEGNLLRKTLGERPFLIKPNRQELEALFGRTLTDEAELLACAKELKAEGAVNVLVSLGAEGALLVDEYGVTHRQPAPLGKVINTVGAGDSLLAGFLSELIGNRQAGKSGFLSADYFNALRVGVAAGSAAAFSLGLPRRAEIVSLLEGMTHGTGVTRDI